VPRRDGRDGLARGPFGTGGRDVSDVPRARRRPADPNRHTSPHRCSEPDTCAKRDADSFSHSHSHSPSSRRDAGTYIYPDRHAHT